MAINTDELRVPDVDEVLTPDPKLQGGISNCRYSRARWYRPEKRSSRSGPRYSSALETVVLLTKSYDELSGCFDPLAGPNIPSYLSFWPKMRAGAIGSDERATRFTGPHNSLEKRPVARTIDSLAVDARPITILPLFGQH